MHGTLTRQSAITTVACALTAALIGCGGESNPDCVGKCDDSSGGWKTNLDGRSDPIANFLRGYAIGDDGEAELDFGIVLDGLAKEQGCDASSIRSFVISDALISEADAFPRLIATVCTDDNTKAPQFFMAASLQEENSEDVDVRTLEMFAWDADARIYRFYETEVLDDKVVKISIDPERCAGCHLGPSDLSRGTMPMQPIMNELSAPWVHWNAEPDFRSHTYVIPDATEESPNFMQHGHNLMGAAPRLEEIVRAGHSLVAGARARERRNRPPEVTAAMSLLRPVFCDEQLNYASEDFGTGLINANVAMSGGIREAYQALGASSWSWSWLADGKLRMDDAGSPLFMVPVRGNADIDYEGSLMAVNVLTPYQILRVRALDWKRPVFSDFRCNLWKDAMTRFAKDPPALDETWRTSKAMQVLFDEIMKVDEFSLAGDSPEQVIAVDVATGDTTVDLFVLLGDDTVPTTCESGICKLSVDDFGNMIDSHVSSIGRAELTTKRDAALCRVLDTVESMPGLPEVACD